MLLDASKAFNRVNYVELFIELLKRDLSPLVLRLLLYMYTNQALAYADDLTLLSPSRSRVATLVGECERYAAEFDIMFNGSKSRQVIFIIF